MVLRSLSVESDAMPPPASAPAAAAARRRCFLLEQCCSKFTKPQHVIPHTCTQTIPTSDDVLEHRNDPPVAQRARLPAQYGIASPKACSQSTTMHDMA